MEFTNDKVLMFLELYEAQSQILNPRHTDHKNINVV